jgi:hypothetical protein
MGSFSAFPPPHSCDFCQKLVLYHKDSQWWGEALESPSGAEGLLSMRARDWMLEKMGSWWKESVGKYEREILRSLSDIAVFDCTLEEARLAAKAGCKFCLAITNKDRHARIGYETNSDAESFLAGLPSRGTFGVLRWRDNKWSCKNDRVKRLEILALSGKLASHSKYLLV